MEACVMLTPAAGYEKTRGILENSSGHPQEFIRSLIIGLFEGSKTDQLDVDAILP